MVPEKYKNIFWSHIDKSKDCWIWTGKHTRDGYGSIHWMGRAYSAHRIAYEIQTNENPGSYEILHVCDNKLCCNPAHLRKGTHSQNMQDMISKGRQAKTISNKRKLTQELANQLREDFLVIGNKHAISRKYEISLVHVRGVLSGKYWKKEVS